MVKYYRYLCAMALGLCAIASCDDDDDEDTSLTMDGSVVLTAMPAYSAPGDTFTFHASGVSVADGVTLTCKFKTSLESAYTDYGTTTFGVRIPDTTGTFSVTCAFSATGYYTTSSTVYTTVLKDDESLSPLPVDFKDTTLCDVRDGCRYTAGHIGSLLWMRTNLSYGGTEQAPAGTPLENAPASRGIFGLFYTWSEAQSACPEGWRLPTTEEFASLTSNSGAYMRDAYLNAERMWPRNNWPAVWLDDSEGFSAIPLGYGARGASGFQFSGFCEYAVFWATDKGSPCCWYLHDEITSFKKWSGVSATDFLAGVRCVK